MNFRHNLRHAAARLRDKFPVPVAYGRWRDTNEQKRALSVLVAAADATPPPLQAEEGTYAGVIFSKDRALQLHALIRSYARHVAKPCPQLTLIYRASTAAHAQAYEEAFALLRRNLGGLSLNVREESSLGFRRTLLDVLGGLQASRVFCLVDDNLFIRPLDFSVFTPYDLRTTVPSLRLGRHITHTYVKNRDHAIPALAPATGGLLRWCWASGEGTWSYPMSVDGNLFDRDEFLTMARFLAFRGPNTFEAGLTRAFGPLFSLRAGVCFEQARVVNIPWNCVQKEIANRCGSLTETELLRRWQADECLDVVDCDNLAANAAHVEIEAHFMRRT